MDTQWAHLVVWTLDGDIPKVRKGKVRTRVRQIQWSCYGVLYEFKLITRKDSNLIPTTELMTDGIRKGSTANKHYCSQGMSLTNQQTVRLWKHINVNVKDVVLPVAGGAVLLQHHSSSSLLSAAGSTCVSLSSSSSSSSSLVEYLLRSPVMPCDRHSDMFRRTAFFSAMLLNSSSSGSSLSGLYVSSRSTTYSKAYWVTLTFDLPYILAHKSLSRIRRP